jgi:3-hydroxyisobutyrate dehydrogenase-like beta-hydroxyacid dehydrogenase
MKDSDIGFLGLGQLGFPIAQNLLRAGYSLKVFNRTGSKADSLVAQGAVRADRPVDAVKAGGIVVSLLWDDASVEGIVHSEDFVNKLGLGGVHISMTTILPETSRKLARLHAEHGAHFVEAPIFGRPEAAIAQKLLICLAGPQAARERVKPLLKAMGAQALYDFGDSAGSATTVKLVGNFMMIASAKAMLEAVTMAETNGVEPKAVVEMLTQSLFDAPIYHIFGKMIVDKTVLFSQSEIVVKDLGLFTKTAERVGSPTSISSFFQHLVQSGS